MENESSNSTLSNAEANSAFWDSAVDAFCEDLIALPSLVKMNRQVTQTILSRCKFDPETTVLMDFACGNGAMSICLAPHCKTIVGVDISQGMVDAYNKRMQNSGLTKARGLRAELRPDEPHLAGQKFDVILCANAYKHINDNVAITQLLRSFIKPNGVLLVVETIHGKEALDVIPDVKSLMVNAMSAVPPPPNLMSHEGGYTEEEIKDIYEKAGLVEFTYEEAFVKEVDGSSWGLFLSKGVNPP